MSQEGFVASGEVMLHYIDWGGEGKPLLMLAGLGNTAHIFDDLAPELAVRFRVVGLTRRGHGRSHKPENGYELPNLVTDIRNFLDDVGVERVILAGSSFAGLEMPLFARRFPTRVEAIIYLDALFPRLDPEPDFSGDPVWSMPPPAPGAEDLVSPGAYLCFQKHVRPDLARIWCPAIEADLLERIHHKKDGGLDYRHDDGLMNRIAAAIWPSRDPRYEDVTAPMLAIVPDGNFHHGVPLDAPDELRRTADCFWLERIRPWIRRRTRLFHQASPSARIIELNAPHHLIFIARQAQTVQAIGDFLSQKIG